MLFILVGAFNQEKALVGAFSVITNLRMEIFQALLSTVPCTVLTTVPSTNTVPNVYCLNIPSPALTNNPFIATTFNRVFNDSERMQKWIFPFGNAEFTIYSHGPSFLGCSSARVSRGSWAVTWLGCPGTECITYCLLRLPVVLRNWLCRGLSR